MKSAIVNSLFRAGFFDLVHRTLGKNRLTVLAYHRIVNHTARDFDTFRPNVSATPAGFATQLDYLQSRFNVVSAEQIVRYLKGDGNLPSYPLFLTFDDGYRDNFENAVPALTQRKMPATIFLATNYVENSRPFDWDMAAYCFHHTEMKEATLPHWGVAKWNGQLSREKLTKQWLEQLKKLPEHKRQQAVDSLPNLLDVTVKDESFQRMHLSWEQVRQAQNAGISMGAHTKTHPILTKVPAERAHEEIVGSIQRIKNETGQPVQLFAYPNGLSNDFSPRIQKLVKDAGISAAFSLLAGPTDLAEVQQSRFAIRRIFVNHKDSLPIFSAKLMGFARLLGE